MKMPPLRPLHWLLFIAIAALFFAWGVWLMRASLPEPTQPLSWLDEWQAQVLAPLADDGLTVAQLNALAEGDIWLQPRLAGGPQLVYRGQWSTDGEPWTLEAEVALTQAERDSLVSATGIGANDAEQPLSERMLSQLAEHRIAGLTLLPSHEVSSGRLSGTLGEPRLRLEMAQGQAWVYPQWGLTVHIEDDRLLLLHAVPRRALQQR